MEYPIITNSCVEEYQSAFTQQALLENNELLQVDHYYFFTHSNFGDVVNDGVLSFDNTFSLHKCLNLTADDVVEQITSGLCDVGDNFSDICEDDLLDIVNDDTSIPHTQKIERTAGELNPLARIFRFKTKPRCRNVKRRKPATYNNLKPYSEVGNLVFNLPNFKDENSLLDERKGRHNTRRCGGESVNQNGKVRSGGAVCDELQDDFCDGTETERRKKRKHKSWTLPEVLTLIEGVSKCGVGRWTMMKRMFFSKCQHRTAAGLKDKWRTLLRSCCRCKGAYVKETSERIPEDILCRVRELSVIHPYPRKLELAKEDQKESKTVASASLIFADNISSL